jgi:putative ABC transport system permease protein
MLVLLSVRRLRQRPLRTALSVGGIAVAVALTFAVQLVNANLTGSYDDMREEISGRAELEVVGRGVDLRPGILRRVRRVPGVGATAVVSEEEAVLRNGRRRVEAHVVGLDEQLRPLLGKERARELLPTAGDSDDVGLYIPASLAERLSVEREDSLVVEVPGQDALVGVARVLDSSRVPAIAQSRIVAAPLDLAQRLTLTQGSFDRLLVDVKAGTTGHLAERLRASLGPTVAVRSTETEGRLLAQASALDRQSTSLFSVISILVGALLAYTAMYLSMLERRREIAELRLAGVSNRSLAFSALCEALLIGVLGSALGILLGLSGFAEVVDHNPAYLEEAFPLAAGSKVPIAVVAASFAVGLVATLGAALVPVRMMLRVPPVAAFDERIALPRQTLAGRLAPVAGWVGGLCLLGGPVVIAVWPEYGAAAVVAFLLGYVLLVGLASRTAVRFAAPLGSKWSAPVELAFAALRAAPSRTGPLIAIVTMTIVALIGVGGAVRNLETGAVDLARGAFSSADLWLVPDMPHNETLTAPLPDGALAAVRALPELGTVSAYRSVFLDWRDRRVTAFAYDPHHVMHEREVVKGNPVSIRDQLASGQGAVLSPALASGLGIEVGDSFTVPTAAGVRRFRLSGLVSNYGWPPGALGLGARDFVRGFGSQTVTAAELEIAPGISEARAHAAVRSVATVLGARVETGANAEHRALEATRQALGQLRRIAVLFLVASLVAVVGVMLIAVAQRGEQLAMLSAVGLSTAQLRAAIFAETFLVLGFASLGGLAGGLLVQLLIARYLAGSAGFPVAFEPAPLPLVAALAAGAVTALVSGAIAARAATRQAVPRSVAYE